MKLKCRLRYSSSVAVTPVSVARVKLFFEKGATNVGLPQTRPLPEVYARVKGGSFERVAVLEKAARLWRVDFHPHRGTGRDRGRCCEVLGEAKSAGITVGAFAFTPVRGTAMEKTPPPDVSNYRRVQCRILPQRGGNAENRTQRREDSEY